METLRPPATSCGHPISLEVINLSWTRSCVATPFMFGTAILQLLQANQHIQASPGYVDLSLEVAALIYEGGKNSLL